MVYQDKVTIEMKTTVCRTLGIKTIELGAKMTDRGDVIRFDLDITNQGLRDRRFKIDENCTIIHSSGCYKCTPSYKVGRPHHVVVDIPKN